MPRKDQLRHIAFCCKFGVGMVALVWQNGRDVFWVVLIHDTAMVERRQSRALNETSTKEGKEERRNRHRSRKIFWLVFVHSLATHWSGHTLVHRLILWKFHYKQTPLSQHDKHHFLCQRQLLYKTSIDGCGRSFVRGQFVFWQVRQTLRRAMSPSSVLSCNSGHSTSPLAGSLAQRPFRRPPCLQASKSYHP